MNALTRPTPAVTHELWKGAVSRSAEAGEIVTNALIEYGPGSLDKETILLLLSALKNLSEVMEIQGSTLGFAFYDTENIDALSEKIADVKTRLETTIPKTRNNFLALLQAYDYAPENIDRIYALLPEYEESSRLYGYAVQIMDNIE